MKKLFVLIAAACMTCTAAFAQTVKPFKEGERAVFLGNSITDGGHYHSYIWLYYMTRFPDMPIRVFNGGIGGDTAYDMNKRLDGDIFAMKPSVLMVTFGMNDSGYFEYNGDKPKEFGEQKYQESIKNYQQMEKRFKDLPDTRIVMVGTSPYDETVQLKENTPFKTKNETIKRLVEYQKESAAKNNWEFTDLNAPMTAINQQYQQKDPTFTLCGSDRIHPDNDGHMVMAYLFLKAQGFVGKEVADMEINANKKQAVKSENCTVSNIKKNGKGLSFDYLAEALPYPLDTIARGWGATWKDEHTNFVYSNCPNNILVLRFADVLLMYAEADLMLNNGSPSDEGVEAMNRIVQRARGLNQGVAVTEDDTPGFGNYDTYTLEDVLLERARELCFERWRWYDLARTGMLEHFLENRNGFSTTKTSFDSDKNYLFPVPLSEIQISTNKDGMYQNPNY